MFAFLEGSGTQNDEAVPGKIDLSDPKEDGIKKGGDEESREQKKLVTRKVKKEDTSEKNTEPNNACTLALDIVHTVCIYIMSIFFLAGSLFFFPAVLEKNKIREPFVFLTLGVLFQLTSSSIGVYKSSKKGVLAIVMSSIELLAGVFWFIATVFLYSKVRKETVFGGLWMLGSLCNLVVTTFCIVKIFMQSGAKPFFLTVSLAISWVANFLFFAGSAHFIAISSNWESGTVCDLRNALGDIAGMFFSGSLLYLIYAAFHTLSLFKGNVKFRVEYSSA